MNDIRRLPPGIIDASFDTQDSKVNTPPAQAIGQERKDDAICDQSGQSPHVSQDHGLGNVQNGNVIDKICDGITKTFDGLGRILGAILKGLGKLAAPVLEGVLDLIKSLVEKLKEIVNYSRSDVIPLATNAAHAIGEGSSAVGQIALNIQAAPAIALGGGIAAISQNPTDSQQEIL
ncbi:MAG: hypothetical protein LBJ13_02010 [Puniceicoccales bacterium]|jgi:hypothetical protein|nr:hypothetical protein [Puniceicoccales bacterium]